MIDYLILFISLLMVSITAYYANISEEIEWSKIETKKEFLNKFIPFYHWIITFKKHWNRLK